MELPSVKSEVKDTDEDFVVQEYDVFLTHNLESKLALFQYPVRPHWRPYDAKNIANVKMKPKQHKVELEIKREEESEYYDKKDDETVLDADEDIANGLAAAKKNRYREILTSTEVPLKTNYAVGVLINNELHITPIQHVLQFRPSFQHLEDSSKKSKKEEKEETETPMDVEDDSGVTPLQVQFKKKETAKSLAAKKRSLQKQAEEEEPWKDLNFVELNDEVKSGWEWMQSKQRVGVAADMDPNAYLEEISPSPAPTAAPPSVGSSTAPISINVIKKLPLEKQIYALLQNTNAMKFSTIVELATAAKSEAEVLNVLMETAVLIKGVWILKSELACEHDKLRCIREFLLLLLHENQYLDRKGVEELSKFPADVITDLLSKFAVHVQSKGWILKEQPDTYFLNTYPDIKDKFEGYWRDKATTIRKNLEFVSVNPQRQFRSGGSNKFVGNTAKEQVEHFLSEMFKKYGVCNYQFLKQNLYTIQKDPDPANLMAGITDDFFRQTLKGMADSIHNAYYLRQSASPEIDEFRNVVLNLFKTKPRIQKADVKEACKAALGKDISNALYTKIMKELAYARGNSQIFKSGNGGDT